MWGGAPGGRAGCGTVQGQEAAGLAQMQRGMAAILATRQTLSRPLCLLLLSEVARYTGQVAEGRGGWPRRRRRSRPVRGGTCSPRRIASRANCCCGTSSRIPPRPKPVSSRLSP